MKRPAPRPRAATGEPPASPRQVPAAQAPAAAGRGAQLRAAGALAVEATTRLADVVEAMHRDLAPLPALLTRAAPGRTGGVTGLVYRGVRGTTRLVGGAVDVLLEGLGPLLGEAAAPPAVEALTGALNGVVGDHLEASGSALAIPMALRADGAPLVLERRALRARLPRAGGRVLVLVHGSCMTDRGWLRAGHDHGAALARDHGWTPAYLHYNSGRHVSTNGRELAGLLEALVAAWPVPVEELALLAHSMGGLVARSACHAGAAAGHAWPARLGRAVFLGTPHHGAPLERAGAVVHALLGAAPWTGALARLARLRSAGVTDLRHGSLLDEDWQGRDRFRLGPDRRRPVPLPAGARCFAAAATSATRTAARARPAAALPGDGLVPVDSALGRHPDPARALAFPRSRQWVGHGMDHLGLLDRPEVYDRLRRWLGP